MTKKNIITSVGIVLISIVCGAATFWFLSVQSQRNSAAGIHSMTDMPSSGTAALQDGAYSVVTSTSKLVWVAHKTLIAGYTDTGNISISNGSVRIANGALQSASFTFDINSITVQSTGMGGMEHALESDLKSTDFFDAATYPTATFVMTGETPSPSQNNPYAVTVHGNLTMKGVTNPIDIPANVYMKDGVAYAQGSVVLDRTKWDIRYGSKAFYAGLGDQVIDDHFTLAFKVRAKK